MMMVWPLPPHTQNCQFIVIDYQCISYYLSFPK